MLRILFLEDSAYDVFLVESELKNANLEFAIKVVETEVDYRLALDEFQPNLILSDHSMPQFNSAIALNIYNEKKLTIPFILVTGSVSEEFAVQTILSGASDYILKSNLIRLPHAIRSAVNTCNLKRENETNENEIRKTNVFLNQIAHSQPILLYVINVDDHFRTTFISENVEKITGYSSTEFINDKDLWNSNLHLDDKLEVMQFLKQNVKCTDETIEYRWKCADGNYKWFIDNMATVIDEFGVTWIHGSRIDVTKLKNADHRQLVFTKGMDEMLFMISHKVRHSISQILGLYYLIEDKAVTDDEIKNTISYMKEPAESLDLFTKELTTLMDDLRLKNRKLN